MNCNADGADRFRTTRQYCTPIQLETAPGHDREESKYEAHDPDTGEDSLESSISEQVEIVERSNDDVALDDGDQGEVRHRTDAEREKESAEDAAEGSRVGDGDVVPGGSRCPRDRGTDRRDDRAQSDVRDGQGSHDPGDQILTESVALRRDDQDGNVDGEVSQTDACCDRRDNVFERCDGHDGGTFTVDAVSNKLVQCNETSTQLSLVDLHVYLLRVTSRNNAHHIPKLLFKNSEELAGS